MQVLSLAAENEVSSVPCDSTLRHFTSIASIVAAAHLSDDFERRAGMDLVAVLDKSGSMGGPKMDMLHQTVKLMIQNLKAVDRLALIAYSDAVDVVLELTPMTPEGKAKALQSVSKINPNGATNLSGGLMMGVSILANRKEITNEVSSILLMTDGLANRGVSNSERLLAIAKKQVASLQTPTSVFTFGIGAEHDSKLLSSISSECGGTYYFIETSDSIPEAFGDCLGGLMSVAAQNITVTLTAASGITIQHVATPFRVTQIQPNTHSIFVGDIYCEEQKDLVLTLSVNPVAEPCEQPLVLIQMEYLNIVTGGTDRYEMVCSLTRTAKGSPIGPASTRVGEQVNRIAVAQAFEVAERMGTAGQIEAARLHLEAIQITIDRAPSTASNVALQRDLRSTLGSMDTPDRFESIGKKKLHVKARKHWSQRESECTPDEPTTYANSFKSFMRGSMK